MSTSSTEIDRLALRIGALRSARRRRSIRDGAWAAERLRLDGIVLDRSDARFGRDAVVRFGHALRVARLRRPWRGGADVGFVRGAASRSWAGRAVAALLVAAVVTLVLFVARPQGGRDDNILAATTTGAGGGAPVASPLRGRSDGLRVAAPVTAATSRPASSGVPFEPNGPETTGSDGNGSGSTSGSTGVSTARPVRTSAPTVAPNVKRLSGRVVDSRTGNGIPGVCVVIGATDCTRSPITDDIGVWTVDLNLGQVLSWNLKFVKADYVQQEINVPSRPG